MIHKIIIIITVFLDLRTRSRREGDRTLEVGALHFYEVGSDILPEFVEEVVYVFVSHLYEKEFEGEGAVDESSPGRPCVPQEGTAEQPVDGEVNEGRGEGEGGQDDDEV
mmetsp:Transcript_14845/g.21420  ORF Transcript_14845/g.21420 Transcript_14845/m.21420 type:complete len:109 (+) Transcript_14845:204-530(+)